MTYQVEVLLMIGIKSQTELKMFEASSDEEAKKEFREIVESIQFGVRPPIKSGGKQEKVEILKKYLWKQVESWNCED